MNMSDIHEHVIALHHRHEESLNNLSYAVDAVREKVDFISTIVLMEGKKHQNNVIFGIVMNLCKELVCSWTNDGQHSCL